MTWTLASKDFRRHRTDGLSPLRVEHLAGSYVLSSLSPLSAVGTAAMAHAQDFNGQFFLREEENAVIAGAETELVAGRLELLDVTGAGGEIAIDRLQDLQGRLAVNGTQIGPSFRGPGDVFFRHPSR
jgi:hypothetical protein